MTDDEVENSINEAARQVASTAAAPSLLDRLAVLARADADLKDRVRQDKLRLMADYRDRVAAINNDYDILASDAVAKLERERITALHQAEDQLRLALAEHEGIAQRLARLG